MEQFIENVLLYDVWFFGKARTGTVMYSSFRSKYDFDGRVSQKVPCREKIVIMTV